MLHATCYILHLTGLHPVVLKNRCKKKKVFLSPSYMTLIAFDRHKGVTDNLLYHACEEKDLYSCSNVILFFSREII